MYTDVELQQQIIRNIRSDVYLAGSQITVLVVRGKAYMRGYVTDSFKQLVALKAAQRVRGLQDISDDITVLQSSANVIVPPMAGICTPL